MSVDTLVYVSTEAGDLLGYGSALIGWGDAVLDRQAEDGFVAFGRDEYRAALVALQPPGQALPVDQGSTWTALLEALGGEMERLDRRAIQLLAETDPASTTELLPDWERVVGLPDPCVTRGQTLSERRVALEGRLTSVGGQSRAFFIQLAARLGYTVTIDDFASATAATAAGIVFTGTQWAHIWRVNVAATVGITPFRVGSGAVGEPLRIWGNEVIECQFNRFKPAHTRVLFSYLA